MNGSFTRLASCAGTTPACSGALGALCLERMFTATVSRAEAVGFRVNLPSH